MIAKIWLFSDLRRIKHKLRWSRTTLSLGKV
jgi:hypothetical protein